MCYLGIKYFSDNYLYGFLPAFLSAVLLSQRNSQLIHKLPYWSGGHVAFVDYESEDYRKMDCLH